MVQCLSSFLSRFPAAKASATSLTRNPRRARGRKEHDETVESGDTGGGSTSVFTRRFSKKPPALRSAPSWDRQIGGVYIAIRPQRKRKRHSLVSQGRKNQAATMTRLRGFRQPGLNHNVRLCGVEILQSTLDSSKKAQKPGQSAHKSGKHFRGVRMLLTSSGARRAAIFRLCWGWGCRPSSRLSPSQPMSPP